MYGQVEKNFDSLREILHSILTQYKSEKLGEKLPSPSEKT